MFNFFKKPESESPKTLSAWEQIIEVVKSDPNVSNLEATRHDIRGNTIWNVRYIING